MHLTAEQQQFYSEHGYLAVEGVVPPERVAGMRQRLEELCQAWDSDEAQRLGVQQEAELAGAMATDRTPRQVRKFSGLYAHEPIFRAHAADPELLAMVAQLIGTPIALYDDQALLKPPRVGSSKLPHQDNAHFRVVPDDALVTCWCALDDATVENGCMHYLPGSHRAGLLPHEPVPGTPHLVPAGVTLEGAVAAPVRAGGVIFHHACTLHFSPPNETEQWRRAFICHFVRADADLGKRDPNRDLPPLPYAPGGGD